MSCDICVTRLLSAFSFCCRHDCTGTLAELYDSQWSVLIFSSLVCHICLIIMVWVVWSCLVDENLKTKPKLYKDDCNIVSVLCVTEAPGWILSHQFPPTNIRHHHSVTLCGYVWNLQCWNPLFLWNRMFTYAQQWHAAQPCFDLILLACGGFCRHESCEEVPSEVF